MLSSSLGPHGRARVVVITGGSSGIGRASALAFARAGWHVGLIARGEAGLSDTQDEIRHAGGTSAFAIADVSDATALDQAATRLEAALGAVEAWVNCAGNGVFGPFLDVSDEEFRRVTDVTYLGTVNGTRVALKRMRPRDSGTVINICSAAAFHGMPLLTSYSGAKYAVRGFADAVRSELLQEGSRVRITTLFPPAVNTPFFSHAVSHMKRPPRPAKPVYQPEIVADAVLLAATKPRREIQISGVTTLFALANKLSPSLMDKVIRRLGYDGQTTDNHRAAALRDPTLFSPSRKASPARGPFDDESRGFSLQMLASRHRGALAAGALGGALVLLALRKKRR
ncbi:SDR family oxidoreductase [Aureimonas psammosilenae]|uniref:SDR family oxidoreductase n=1 Tax=Aureimonas psammosilenae TaxID=2495496 RepID=UPI001869D928|nr:SDR family oxidoreductase [Aureimonas psammosilenae]